MMRKFIQMISNNWAAKIVSLVAAIFIYWVFQIFNQETRFFSIPITVIPADSLVSSTELPQTARVTISGEDESVGLVLEDDIKVFINLSNISKEGFYTIPVQIEKHDTALQAQYLDIRVDPLDVDINLEAVMTREIPIKPSFEGFTARGYDLSQTFLSPETVTVEGPKSKVEFLEVIETTTVYLTDRTDDFAIHVRLQKPDNALTFTSGDRVEVSGVIQEIVRVKEFSNSDIIYYDLDTEFIIENDIGLAVVTVQGKQLDLEAIVPDDIYLVFNCSNITAPGVYRLETTPEIPQGLSVLEWEPRRVTAVVSAVAEENTESSPSSSSSSLSQSVSSQSAGLVEQSSSQRSSDSGSSE